MKFKAFIEVELPDEDVTRLYTYPSNAERELETSIRALVRQMGGVVKDIEWK